MRTRRAELRAATVVAVVALALSGCALNEMGDAESDLRGTIDGVGSSAQASAQNSWVAGFQRQHGSVTVNYDPAGSGAGRQQFLAGAVAFAGTDIAATVAELDGVAASDSRNRRCAHGAGAIHLPVYISSIVLAYRVDGVDELALDASAIARIYSGSITRWNDPAIVALNPGETLPDAPITAVRRSDASGTTLNFTEFLASAAPADWTTAPADTIAGSGESAQGNSGVASVVRDGRNVIGFLDGSRAAEFDTVSLLVGGEQVPATAEAAAAAVDASPEATGRAADDLVIDLYHASTEPGVYPLVLVSYLLVCRRYERANEGEIVHAYLEWVASEEAQQIAADAAGSAPISDELRERVLAAIAPIH
ncbi:phosphate ABC transporter substrate-binding protein PstS [Agromyces protaetiae]|uniref:Phosphate-binding protein n=1 Tax=Agromyces protaetiae TaxID=2509455 RepID=A0A4P6FP14_9MICO|nr:phosphate ABC transporter substrate-binding protein PstS [Agromyces protaetiae]QAY72228.1 phosphate ABC transporter substrate-binding protein PstS [Agromyces protaetiae]